MASPAPRSCTLLPLTRSPSSPHRNYTALIEAMHNKGEQGGKLFTLKAKTEPEFAAALQAARDRPDHLCFLEVTIDKDDCSKELLEWGSRVAAANSRPPVRH